MRILPYDQVGEDGKGVSARRQPIEGRDGYMDLVTHAIDFHQGLSWFRRNENASEMRNHERVEEDSIRSNLLGKLPQSDGALGFHTKGQGHRQGIGRIKLRSGLQSEHSLNHFGNSHFTGIAISNDGLLDFSGCYFKYG